MASTGKEPLRDYQQAAVAAAQAAINGRVDILLAAPTGSGKTRIAIEVFRAQGDGPAIMLCPWVSLVHQSVDYLNEQGVPAGKILGSTNPKDGDHVHVTTVATAAVRDMDLSKYKLACFDEAHRSRSNTAELVVAKLKCPLFGLTATPRRLDGRPLDKVFDRIHVVATTAELVQRGFLCKSKVLGPLQPPPDLGNLRWDPVRHDYVPAVAGRKMSDEKLLGDAAQHWKQHAKGRPAIAFCCTVAHAAVTAERLRRQGASVALVTGQTCQTDRKDAFDALQSGNLDVICSVGVLTEGIDIPELSCLILLRPTLSESLHLQMLGRALRVAGGKEDALFLDHAGNHHRHGFAEDDREWSLKGIEPKKRPKRGQPAEPEKERARPCPQCRTLMRAEAPMCPVCNWLPPQSLQNLPDVRPGKLIPLVARPPRKRRRAA